MVTFEEVLHGDWDPEHSRLAASLDWSLPLHLKKVPAVNFISVATVVKEHSLATYGLFEHLQYYTDVDWLEALTARIASPLHHRKANLGPRDLEVLLNEGIIEPCQNPRCSVNVFTVCEAEKSRRRLICEPILNESARHRPVMLLGDQFSLAPLQADAAITFDVPWYYGQFVLPNACRPFFAFKSEHTEADGTITERWWQCTTFPTGGRQVAAIAQALSLIARDLAVLLAGKPPITSTVYIDNFRFEGTVRDLWHILPFARRALEQLTICFPIVCVPETSYEFLGIAWDHTNKTVALSNRFRSKLLRIASGVKERMKFHDVLSVFAKLVYATRVLRTQVHEYYYVYKFVRRKSRTHTVNSTVQLWRQLPRLFRRWTEAVLTSPPHALKNPSTAITIFSDASLGDFGYIIIGLGRTITFGSAFEHIEDIHILEARALLYALRHVERLVSSELCTDTSLYIRIDNTTVQGAVEKKRSNSFILNSIIGKIQSVLKKFGKYDVEYIKSKANPADLITRVCYF